MWFRTDDGFLEHVKVIRAADVLGGPNALGRVAAVWLEGGLYAARNLTDGFIPARVVARFLTDDAPDVVASALVSARIWVAVPDGFLVHDWPDYQPSGTDVKAKRARDRDRKRAANGSTGNIPPGFHTDSGRNRDGNDADSGALARARDPVPDPLPQRSKAEKPNAARVLGPRASVFEVRAAIQAATHATVERGDHVNPDGSPNAGAISDEVRQIAAHDLRATWDHSNEIESIIDGTLRTRERRDEATAARERFRKREGKALRR